jgi:RNA polymerase sigma-70 factor (ECF subfamily)
VVQDAYLRAYKGLKRFRGDARFSTWMYRITANCASTYLAKRTRASHDELDDESPIADERPDHDPQLQASASFDRDRVARAVAELPPRLRSVVVLRDVYDLSHEAIAAELGISEAAAKVRLHRARRKLREGLFPLRTEQQMSEGGDAHAV